MKCNLLNLIACGFLASSPAAAAPGKTNSVILKSVMVIDGTGTPPVGPMDVEIIGNKISRMGKEFKSDASIVIDGSGKTLIPGLIDCHTHLRTVPGSVFRNESVIEIQQQQLKQLQAYLAAGVTTVLDAASPTTLFSEISK